MVPTSTSCWEASSLSRLSSRWNTIGSLVQQRLAGPSGLCSSPTLWWHISRSVNAFGIRLSRHIWRDQLGHCGNVESNYRKFWRWWWHMAASLDDEPSILTVGPIIVSRSQLGVLECLIIIAQSLLGTSPRQRFWIYIHQFWHMAHVRISKTCSS